jgi:uncharacterized membrane protein YfcA
MILSGLVAGWMSGLLGVGGGLILVPIFVHVFKMDAHAAIGTSLAVIIPTALMGATKHTMEHAVDGRVAFFVAVGALIGAFWGAQLSLSLETTLLKRIFAAFLLVVAVYMYVRA